MSWLDGPIASFDVESTGVDVEQDRIVTFCVGWLEDGEWISHDGVVNPGVPIPEAASNVHGITDEQAAQGMSPKDGCRTIVEGLYAAWRQKIPVVIYNAPFDLTMLDREMRRHWDSPLIVSGPVIDPLVLDRAVDRYRRGSRRLSDTCKHYGVALSEDAAHTAAGDAYAAVQLARKVIEHGVDAGSQDKLTDFSLADLYRAQQGWFTEQRESFHAYLARKGEKPDDPNTVWPLKPWNGDKP